MRDVVQDVEPRDALLGEQLRGVALRLLEQRGEDVAGVHLVPLRALHVENRRLQHPTERDGLLWLALLAAALPLDRFVEVGAERAAERRKVRAAGREDAFAVRIVGQDVEQVLERQVGMPARDRLAERNAQNDFNGR